MGADFNVSLNSSSITLAQGATTTDNITATAVNNFKGTVSFTCTVPTQFPGVSCLVGGPITGSGTAVVTISRTSTASIPGRVDIPWSLSLFVATISLIFVAALRGSRVGFIPWRVGARLAFPLIVGVVIMAMSGCGDGSESSSTVTTGPATAGNVVVTATSGNVSHTAQVTVTLD